MFEAKNKVKYRILKPFIFIPCSHRLEYHTNLEHWLQSYKTFFMLNSAEHEIFSANKYKMPTNVGILIIYELRKLHTQLN